jgi:hypothetical protein
MNHIEAHLLCSSSERLSTGRGMLQKPQNCSVPAKSLPHIRHDGSGSGLGSNGCRHGLAHSPGALS